MFRACAVMAALTLGYVTTTLPSRPHYSCRKALRMRPRLIAIMAGVQPEALILVGRDRAGTLTAEKVLVTTVALPCQRGGNH